MSFITGTPDLNHVVSLHMLSELGFRVIRPFHDFVLMMLPLNFKGELAYAFLRKVSTIVPTPFETKIYDIAVSIYRGTVGK